MNRFAGVYTALLVPRKSDGELDLASYRYQVEALEGKGLTGYAVNGATGEFTLSSETELQQLLWETRIAAPDAEILCGVGAADAHGAIRRMRIASSFGAKAVLLPMPYFFPYRQDDLREFVHAVASDTDLPVLLYNLPQFTSGLEVDTVLLLLREHPNIEGIKDSSGSLEIMRAITREGLGAARLIGNDSALCDAMIEGVCDGVVSGVASVLPELMTSLFASGGQGASFADSRRSLEAFIDRLAPLPTPWGLKVTSAVRGFTQESYPFPLSSDREKEITQLRRWFAEWYKQTLEKQVRHE